MDCAPVNETQVNNQCEPIDFSLTKPGKHNNYRVMVRQGDSYIGDVDGDGTMDVWTGMFTADNMFGVGNFTFNGGKENVYPSSFLSTNGKTYSLGDKVDVKTNLGYVRNNLTIKEWHPVVARGELSTQPSHILVSINFFVNEGFRNFYNIDNIILKSAEASIGRYSYKEVSSEFDLRIAKNNIEFDFQRLLSSSPLERKSPYYRSQVRSVLSRYFKLLKDLFEFWPLVIKARREGDHNSFPGVRLEYDYPGYKRIVEEMWNNSLRLLKDYETANNHDRWMRRDLVGDLNRHTQFSELSHESFFYSDLSQKILNESFG